MLSLLIILLICHWVGDYTHAVRPWMLKAKRIGRPVGPIAAHACVHAVLMAVACWLMVGPEAAVIAFAIQFPTHLAIDVAKGRGSATVPALAEATNVWFWWVFGLDQLLHTLVLVLIVWTIDLLPPC